MIPHTLFPTYLAGIGVFSDRPLLEPEMPKNRRSGMKIISFFPVPGKPGLVEIDLTLEGSEGKEDKFVRLPADIDELPKALKLLSDKSLIDIFKQ